MENGKLICALPEQRPIDFDMSGFALAGIHNLENAAAAALTALLSRGTAEGIQTALATFKGLHHRLEYVRDHNGVRYYDDSKGTNVDAVARALESFNDSIILIMGGRDKGGDYSPLKELVAERVKRLVVIGEAKEIICNALGDAADTEEASTLEDAVKRASYGASPGDTVLLSPGCSSFDMFTDYVERGQVFQKAVYSL
jgi:UDP-N-acetylmuramoylalanine--D-glutamate ligase